MAGSGKFKLLLTAALCWSVGLVNSEAGIFTWINQTASGDYFAFDKWDPTGIPGVGDQANFTNNFAYTLTFSFDAQTGSATFNGSSGTVTQDIGAGTTWNVTNSVFVAAGNNTTTTVVHVSGLLAVTNLNSTASLSLGQGAASLGRLIVSGAATTARVDTLIIGSSGIGLMTVSNSAFQVRNVTVGSLAGSSGTMALAGGSTKVASNLVVAIAANSTGTVSLTSGSLVVTNGTFGVGNSGTVVGGGGVGQATVSNATMLASTILLGSSAGGQGSLRIRTGGRVICSNSTSEISVNSTNSLTVEGNVQPVPVLDIPNGEIKIGVVANGIMTLDGGSVTCAVVTVGDTVLGTCRMKAGTLTMSSVLTIGNNPTSTGIIWMDGGNWLSSSRTTIGNNGVGQITISNGTITLPRVVVSGIGTSQNPGTFTIAGGTVFSTNLVVGFDVNSTGTVWVTAGSLNVTNAGSTAQLIVGRSGRGLLTLSNGTLVADQILVTNGTKSTFSFVGGTLKTRNTLVTNGAQFVVGNGTSSATLNLLGGAHTFANGLKISTNVTLTGSGTVTGTVVNAGTILADAATLAFKNEVTNNATFIARNGGLLKFFAPVVNGGVIDASAGGIVFTTNFTNNGVLLLPPTAIQLIGIDAVISIQSVTGVGSYQLQRRDSLTTGNWTNVGVTNTGNGALLQFTDPGGATNRPGRLYRVRTGP